MEGRDRLKSPSDYFETERSQQEQQQHDKKSRNQSQSQASMTKQVFGIASRLMSHLQSDVRSREDFKMDQDFQHNVCSMPLKSSGLDQNECRHVDSEAGTFISLDDTGSSSASVVECSSQCDDSLYLPKRASLALSELRSKKHQYQGAVESASSVNSHDTDIEVLASHVSSSHLPPEITVLNNEAKKLLQSIELASYKSPPSKPASRNSGDKKVKPTDRSCNSSDTDDYSFAHRQYNNDRFEEDQDDQRSLLSLATEDDDDMLGEIKNLESSLATLQQDLNGAMFTGYDDSSVEGDEGRYQDLEGGYDIDSNDCLHDSLSRSDRVRAFWMSAMMEITLAMKTLRSNSGDHYNGRQTNHQQQSISNLPLYSAIALLWAFVILVMTGKLGFNFFANENSGDVDQDREIFVTSWLDTLKWMFANGY